MRPGSGGAAQLPGGHQPGIKRASSASRKPAPNRSSELLQAATGPRTVFRRRRAAARRGPGVAARDVSRHGAAREVEQRELASVGLVPVSQAHRFVPSRGWACPASAAGCPAARSCAARPARWRRRRRSSRAPPGRPSSAPPGKWLGVRSASGSRPSSRSAGSLRRPRTECRQS